MAIQQGWNQMTAATQHTIRKAFGRVAGTRRRRKAAKRSTTKRRTSSRRTKRGNAQRFVKGSAAARRYMAKIRKLRKR